jgi:TPR repeat protein
MAAKQNNSEALFMLGRLYLLDDFENADIDNAIFWLNKAAEQNHYFARYTLGTIYESGMKHIAQDYIQAYMWYWLACTKSELPCGTIPLFSSPESIGKKMSESEINQAVMLAKEWLNKHSNN